MPPAFTQQQLRRAFARWGLPEELRCDNGTPWGSSGDLPTALALWLVGLGVGLHYNPPRQPQDNGVVERWQGIGKCWAEPETCTSAKQLQQRLDEADRRQRESYPVKDGQSRLQAYPELRHSGRPYAARRERQQWKEAAVWTYLSQQLVSRKVDSQGKVSLYNRLHTVGMLWAGQTIWVTIDGDSREWVYLDRQGHEIRRRPASEITAESIRKLAVGFRRGNA